MDSFRSGDPEFLWRIGLYDRDGDQLGLIKPESATLTVRFNDIDTMSFSTLLTDPAVNDIWPMISIVRLWRSTVGMSAIVDRPDYCGIVVRIDEDAAANTVTFQTSSPLLQLSGRTVRTPVSYTQDQGDILGSLLGVTNGYMDTYIEMGTIESTVTRTRDYERGQNVWSAWRDLMTIDYGPDIRARYYYDDGDPLLMYVDVVPAVGEVRDDTRLDYNVGVKNLANLTRGIVAEPGTFATWVVSESQGEDGIALRGTAKFAAGEADAYGLWERIDQIQNIQTTTYLDAYSEQTLKFSKEPQKIYTPTVSKKMSPVWRRDIDLGDVVAMAANKGRMVIDELTRVYGATIVRDKDGAEDLTLTTAQDFASILS